MDLPKETENLYLAAHFDKLDKDFANITKASKQTDLLTQSINFMETMRQVAANQKAHKKALKTGRGPAEFGKGTGAPYLLINKNAMASGGAYTAKEYQPRKDAHNERAQR